MTIDVYTPKTTEEIQKIEDLLLSHYGTQIKDIWKVGLCLGLRINDLLSIKFSDINDDTFQLELYKYRSKQTSIIHFTPQVKEIILSIQSQHPTDKFLFQSHNSLDIKNGESKPISKQDVYVAFKEVGEILNIKLLPSLIGHTAVTNTLNYIQDLPLSNLYPKDKNEIIAKNKID
jgi:integrase